MRQAFAKTVLSRFNQDDCFFLTGDLGFMALEEVRDAFGERFINVGVAEQNMIGVAAGLAKEGYRVIVYSIAPFCYARPFEQIRNDLCFSNLPVCLVGNGGGYAYGHMGPTHHALEDCAAMNALGVHVCVPAFDDDLGAILEGFASPTYLRLGYDQRLLEQRVPSYEPWRQLLEGSKGAVAALGPLASLVWQVLSELPTELRPALWVVSEFDINSVPAKFLQQVSNSSLYVFEEHVRCGGLGMHLSYVLASNRIRLAELVHRTAMGYPSGRFGSQSFHRRECGLDILSIQELFCVSP